MLLLIQIKKAGREIRNHNALYVNREATAGTPCYSATIYMLKSIVHYTHISLPYAIISRFICSRV